MTDKVTLANVGSLIDATTAANTINSNSAAIVAAMDNTLSRDGTAPNQMQAPLDMNSNRIVNLPTPITVNEPARLVDLNTVIGGGTITVNPLPTGGTINQLLKKNSSTNFDAGWVDPASVAPTIVGTAANIAALKATATTLITCQLTQAGRAGIFVWTLGNFATQVAADSNTGVYVTSNSFAATVGAWVRVFDATNFQSSWFGTINDYVTDNSAIINTIIATAGFSTTRRDSAYINIEPGVTFSSSSLTFLPAASHVYVYLRYFANSDLTKGVSSGGLGTNEMQLLSVNSGFPGDPTGGMVAESIFNAPLHPAYIANISKQITSADNHFGTGQTRIPTDTLAARASYNLFDENVIRWRAVYEAYGTPTSNSGVSLQPFNATVALANVGTTGWPTTPATGVIVTGVTSGAKGYKAPTQTNPTLVLNLVWITGTFIAGEKVTDGVTTSTNNITGGGVDFENQTFPSMIFGTNIPVLTYGIFPNNALTAFSVAGRTTLAPTHSSVAANLKETVTNPALLFTSAIGVIPTTGKQIVLDNSNRLVTVNGVANTTGSTGNGLVGGIAAAGSFSDGGLTNVFNVTSSTRGSTGVYNVVFTNALASANYTVSTGRSNVADFFTVTGKTTAGFSLNSFNSSAVATNLIGIVDVTVAGGQ